MVTKVCALKLGGDFGPEHVQWLARQVPGLVCISDAPVAGVPTIKPEIDLPGWWIKMNAFSPNVVQGDILLIDLDTVVLSLPDMPTETTVLRDFTEPSVMGSGFMFVTQADRERIWEAWIADPDRHMRENTRWPKWGDQGFLQDIIGGAAKWGSEVVSYKVHCRGGVPADARTVCFHGKPRPWAVQAAWIPPLHPVPELHDFRELILKHKGKRFVVMGGGPSLAADLERIGPADVYISTNGHGVGLRKPDYLLAIDHTHTGRQVPMGQHLRALSDAPIISPHGFADYRLGFYPECPRFVLSGLVATWAAFAMGAKVVTLAGMDGYADNDYRGEARKIARDVHCPVRVMAESPLADVWPVFDPAERFGRYTPHSSIDGLRGIDNSIRVRARKPCRVGMVELDRGQEMVGMRHEFALLLKHRMLEEV